MRNKAKKSGGKRVRLTTAIVLAAAIVPVGLRCIAADSPAATPSSPYALVPHSDTQYAHELFRLKQYDVIKTQQSAAAGTASENLWKAQQLLAQWDELTKNKSEAAALSHDYMTAVTEYLKSQSKGIDGAWALDHAQFVLSKLSQPILTRMEYWGNNRKDRAQLAPLAALADGLLNQAATSLDAMMKDLESKKPFDEPAYLRGFSAAAEVKYYAAWSDYFKAMAMEPASEDRAKLLSRAAAALDEWAVDDQDNGVNSQAYLLRGKVFAEAGEWAKATADFAKAQTDKAPNWVQYQGRYQTVVTALRSGDFKQAQTTLDAFKKWIPKDNIEAQLSTDMLGYRVAWAMAENKANAADKKKAELAALGLLNAVIARDGRFRDLVYDQLAAQIPDDADVASLLPMQQMALAHGNSVNQRGDTPESRKQLQLAIDAALAARANAAADKPEKVEATFLAGACSALLNNLAQAAQYNVEFAEMAPTDPRAKQMVELALQHLGELRKQAAAVPGVAGSGGLSSEMRDVALRALALSTGTFGDKQWLYSQGRLLEESGKPVEAAAAYTKVEKDDRNYLDARYRLVTIATEHFSSLDSASPAAVMQKAADDLFKACTNFIELLDHPPASAPKEVLEAAKSYRYNIWLIESATALNPAVKDTAIAIDRLTKLDNAKDQLNDAQRATVLQYRIQAYQLAGQADKAFQVVEEYAKANGQDAMNVIRGMALSTVDEIDKVEPTDPAQAKRLASYVVQLLNPMITAAGNEGKKDSAYEYRLIQADMMVRAGQFKEAQTLAVELQKEKETDIRGFMDEARAIFGEASNTSDAKEFAKSQDYFTRILARLPPGSESFWESWLRIIQSMQGQQAGSSAADDSIKKRLSDLKGVYGSKFGGERFKDDFRRLTIKYAIQ